MISVTLPMPPSTNNLFATVIVKGKLRRIRSKKYDAWCNEANWLVRIAAAAKQIEGPYSLQLWAKRTTKRRDLDNLAKPICDALVKGGAIADDSLAETIAMSWSDLPSLDGVLVHVHPIGKPLQEAA